MDAKKYLRDKIQSTPGNNGAGRRMSSQKNTRADFEPYLTVDVSKEQEVSIEDFMKLILDRDDWTELTQSQKVKDMSMDSTFNAYMREYGDAKNEKELYHPFVKLANHVLQSDDSSGEPSGIILCRNDPIEVRGSERGISPDVVGTRTEAVTKTKRISPENCKMGPKMLPFHWLEILWNVEFKLTLQAIRDMNAWRSQTAEGIPPDGEALSGEGGPDSAPPTSSEKQQLPQKRFREGDVPDEEEDAPESKRSKTGPPQRDVKVQCASYALEMLSNGAPRTHALGLYINGYTLRIQYFERSIFVSSRPFSLRAEPCKLIALLYVFRALNKPQWGIIPGFDRPFTVPTAGKIKTGLCSKDFLRGHTFKLSNGSILQFRDILSRYHGLIGRGTIVIQAQISTDPNPNQVFAVKISSPAISRKNENDLVQLAYAKATGKFEFMRDHLPKLRHWEDIDLGQNSSRAKLAGFYDASKYERRALRLITFLELWPIRRLGTDRLSKAFRDILKCYRWLYEAVGILHRDISLDNMMYYLKDKKVYGVLNDFDLATLASDSSPSSMQRTGSVPYMAYELVKTSGTRHLYRHDLESFFYVLLILTSHFENGKEVAGSKYHHWFWEDLKKLCMEKIGVLSLPTSVEESQLKRPYSPFIKWLRPLRDMFSVVLRYDPSDTTVDEETLGGQITFDKMDEILEIDLHTKDKLFQ